MNKWLIFESETIDCVRQFREWKEFSVCRTKLLSGIRLYLGFKFKDSHWKEKES